ncbi:hypothetical protein BGZ54_001332 [Gamsiella multidivaricata]|nr:hypothetical protein BGZ54_001332 [Gamsiella multidivaricata]
MKISILISIAAVVVAVADGATPGEDKIPALSPVFNGIEPHFSSVLSRRDDPFDLEADNLLEKRKDAAPNVVVAVLVNFASDQDVAPTVKWDATGRAVAPRTPTAVREVHAAEKEPTVYGLKEERQVAAQMASFVMLEARVPYTI